MPSHTLRKTLAQTGSTVSRAHKKESSGILKADRKTSGHPIGLTPYLDVTAVSVQSGQPTGRFLNRKGAVYGIHLAFLAGK